MKQQINAIRRKIMGKLTHKIGISTTDSSEITNINRILIVRPNSRLGNQLMLTPLFQEIEETFPDAKVDLFVRGGLAPILFKNYKSINRIIKLPSKPFKQLFQYIRTWISLRKYRYDLVFNIDPGSSSGRLATQYVRGKIKFFGERDASLVGIEDYKHMARWPVYNFRLYLSKMGYETKNGAVKPLSLHLSSEEKYDGQKLLKKIVGNDKPTIMFYTFATGDKKLSKTWWQNMYHHLKKTYGNDYNLLEILPKENVSQIDFAAPTYYSRDIREIASVLDNGAIFITGDCGMMHLAASVDIPVVALFSITKIETYKPYNQGSLAVYIDEINMDCLYESIDKILTT